MNRRLAHHKAIMKKLISRDKNHPIVVMWCVANEASTMEENAHAYFKGLIKKRENGMTVRL